MNFMKAEELKLILREGEGLSVEFKEKFTPRIDRDIVAFSNTKGGFLFLGVNDSGKIVGEKLTNEMKADISSIARNCDPEIHIKSVKQSGDVVVIEIPEGEEKPYSSSYGYCRRLDAVTQKMTQKEVRSFFRETDAAAFESLACNKAGIKDVSIAKVKAFLKETGTSLKVSRANSTMVLSSLGALYKDNVNNVGALMFAANVDKAIPHSESILVAFKGTGRTHIFDRRDVRDDLLTQFNEAVSFLMKHLNIRSEIRGVNRYDIYEIPLDALREAVVNAIIHRDYAIKGTSIYVMVYDDRVEIENPGELLSGVTVNSLDKLSLRRNPVIADLFHRMGKVERLGSGIKRMRDLCREAGLKEPIFEIDPFFRVIFYRNPEYSLKNPAELMLRDSGTDLEKRFGEMVRRNSSEKWFKTKSTRGYPEKKLGEKVRRKSSERILLLLGEKPSISAQEMAHIIGISSRAVEKHLSKMKGDNIIKRVGSARGGRWKVLENKGR